MSLYKKILTFAELSLKGHSSIFLFRKNNPPRNVFGGLFLCFRMLQNAGMITLNETSKYGIF